MAYRETGHMGRRVDVAEETRVGLGDMLRALRLRWRIATVVFLGIVAGTVAYAYSLPKEYTAKSVVALTPRPNTGASASDVVQLGQKYVAYVTAPTTTRAVAPTVGMSRSELGDAVSADVATGSVDLTIKVQARSPRQAADAANALSDAAVSLAAGDDLLTADTVAPATIPTAPSKPRRKLYEGAGALVALLVAAAVAFLVERGRPRVRSALEVGFITGHGVLARLPSSRAVRGGIRDALADPVVGGAVRSLRTVLDQVGRDTSIRTLAVTSSVPGEGKSTVAGSLGWAIASLDANVLLVDADLRHPSVARLFGVPAQPGLVEVLRGQARLADVVRPAPGVPGLSVLATSGVGETGDLLARNLHTVLHAAANEYDVVIVDTPPLLVGDDAGTIATISDAVLMVVSSGVEMRRVSEAVRDLETVQAQVIGIVLNRADVPSYGYTYRTTAEPGAPRRGGPTAA